MHFGWRFTWVVDHDVIQKCVTNLPNLRKLALSRDTYAEAYPDAETASQFGDYYESMRIRESDAHTAFAVELYATNYNVLDRIRLVFENQHLGDMIAIAKTYATLLPKLEWIYLGQYPMRLDRTAEGAGIAVPLSDQRDECYTYLNRLFGRENDVSI